MAGLTLLHTSDWHLGHQIYRKRRDEEFADFLAWLTATIKEKSVDHLIVAGDVFDTATPGASSQRMYYEFLVRAAQAGARSIIVTAGNHDSPAFLTAPRELLKSLKVYVVGAIADKHEDEILLLSDEHGVPEAIVCAVPYLRERDARQFIPGESIADKERQLVAGIASHYQEIAAKAQQIRESMGCEIPIIATGHLFVSGAASGDGERNLYIGTLGQIPIDIFPDSFDYVALGHIHKPQKIGNLETRRYSGSPLPMSFAEAGHNKSAVLARFNGRKAQIETIPTPEFRKFESISGNRETILRRLREMAASPITSQRDTWLEITHDGSEPAGDLRQLAGEIVKDSPYEILCIKTGLRQLAHDKPREMRRLEEFTPVEMFSRRLDQLNIKESKRKPLYEAFDELLALCHETQRRMEE